jgi:hypothetical protein
MEDHTRDAHDVGTAHTSPVAGLSSPTLEEPQVLPDDYIWHTEYPKVILIQYKHDTLADIRSHELVMTTHQAMTAHVDRSPFYHLLPRTLNPHMVVVMTASSMSNMHTPRGEWNYCTNSMT